MLTISSFSNQNKNPSIERVFLINHLNTSQFHKILIQNVDILDHFIVLNRITDIGFSEIRPYHIDIERHLFRASLYSGQSSILWDL